MNTAARVGMSWALGGLALLALAGCGASSEGAGPEPGADDTGPPAGSEIQPGVGIVAGGVEVALGDARAAIEERLGPAPRSRDVDLLGVRLEYPELGLTLGLAGPGPEDPVTALELAAPFEGLTAEGVGIGSTEEEVSELCAGTIRDPFQGSWWCPEAGLVFQWEDSLVARITLVGSGPRR
ncbi:MAG: hypothetical protein FJ098_02110 [Deltaproteobacteria bacterium]|nr:hypothetical protein [Deltaproteobacteria bacterium]